MHKHMDDNNHLSFTSMQVTKSEFKLRVDDPKSVGPWVCAKGTVFSVSKREKIGLSSSNLIQYEEYPMVSNAS